MINAQTILDFAQDQTNTNATEAVLELRELELSLVGGGSGEVLF